MYLMEKEGQKFTLPKESIRYLAMQMAMDRGVSPRLDTAENAIKFLNQLGWKVEDYKCREQ